ncbi:MAG: hypothetical protein ACXWL2_01260 [Candidatus Chromulinivorax sp.]
MKFEKNILAFALLFAMISTVYAQEEIDAQITTTQEETNDQLISNEETAEKKITTEQQEALQDIISTTIIAIGQEIIENHTPKPTQISAQDAKAMLETVANGLVAGSTFSLNGITYTVIANA